ncbi:Aldo/keto reductase [Coprinopsis marcescibilis]|uniref:Aldo/keto reductase n=1 Tax=Coprinopsis marcescibilis TaxID=230819 RepID=A0A5C3L8H8_COPMA|nr:Aldo/keto reductase [Coprinopsis marcescibilis]
MTFQQFGHKLVVPQDTEEDFPRPGRHLEKIELPLDLPVIVYGAGSFSNQYNSDHHIKSELPLRTVRLALRYGIRAFDTSAYYGPSEVVLGTILESIRDEFPRSSYRLMTKCGRYGVSAFDYEPDTIRQSVIRSLERLKTDYLDVVYLHDVEFVADPVLPRTSGNAISALQDEAAAFGLGVGDEGKIRGEGDVKILKAFAELQKLKDEGIIKNIGITGYPLPTLLRLALLILHNPPYKPLDILLSYSHLCLQNSNFARFAGEFRERAKVGTLMAASPLSMGLLTNRIPDWHPAPPKLRDAVKEAIAGWEGDFPNLALGYSINETGIDNGNVPLVLGLSTPAEVHKAIKVWRETRDRAGDVARRKAGEKKAQEVFARAKYLDWSWPSP